MKRLFLALVCISFLAGCQNGEKAALPAKTKMGDIIGGSHVIGRYYFTNKDYLNEGADEILAMGSRVIKIWFYNADETPDVMYPYNSNWPKVSSLVEGAKLPYWKTFFDKPFTTFLIYHQSFGKPGYYFNGGITDEQAADDMQQTYELAKYFLTEYKNTGKTFIFCSSELDWHIKDRADPNCETQPERFEYARKWLQARQDGVEKARQEVGTNGVRVFHATEVVNVMKSIKDGQDNVVNKVLPLVDLDLVGYSAYDSTVYDRVREAKELKIALDFIGAHAKESKYFGKKNVFIAEWGIPENEFSQPDVKKLTENVVKTGLDWGCPYIVHWQLYCNEPKKPFRVPYPEFKKSPSWNIDDFRGFWLIRPDGSRNYTYNYLKELCTTDSLPKDEKVEMSMYSYKPLCEIIGSTHTRPNYYFGDKDSLNEGAARLLEMGSKVIKVWFSMGKGESPGVMYKWNSSWPDVNSLVELAKVKYWRDLFNKPFKTYIMNVMEMVPMDNYYWKENFTQEQEAEVERQMYELTKYFLTEYAGTKKTFILANHETDWHLEGKPGNWDIEAPDHVYANAVKWFNARQRGVERARKEIGMKDVYVWHAGEVVHVLKSMKEGQKNMVNMILPKVKFDLISYSCWDSIVIGGVHDKKDLKDTLDYIASKAIDSDYFGGKNVYLGEFGIPENDFSSQDFQKCIKNTVETGLEWGCPYIVYWQLYCNEPRPNVTVPDSNNKNHRGFWLIRADGSKAWSYDYFSQLLKNK